MRLSTMAWLSGLMFSGLLSAETLPEMTVYRSPTCGCCGKWIEHVKKSGFNVKDVISDDMQAIKAKVGLPPQLASCHTATVGDYVVEGHVPVDDVKKLLSTKPKLSGIAAPGMPQGSPGMETAGAHDPYQVISYDRDGKIEVFAEH